MGEFDPHDHEARRALWVHHPMITNQFTTYTPSIPKVVGVALDAVMLHKKSICFNALPQMGKTKIFQSCGAALEEHPDYKDRYLIKITADAHSHENVIRTIHRFLALPKPKIFKLDETREDILATIEGRLNLLQGRHAVLLIDEMQRLRIDDYECLHFLQNELAIRNISLTVIGFAQADIETSLTKLRENRRAELIIRFLNEIVGVPVCDSEQWVEETLSSYDDALIYPIDSDCTYTQFFLPIAYDAGFRIGNYAREIFMALEEAKISHNLPCIPTVCAFEMFRLLLIRSSKIDSVEFVVNAQILAPLIDECQIASYAANFLKASVGRGNI